MKLFTSGMGHLCVLSRCYIHILSIIILLSPCVSAKAQQLEQSDTAQGQLPLNEQPTTNPETSSGLPLRSSIHQLKIGDAIPDELWNTPLQVVNHPDGKETIKLADYKGKLIILDFWATWCAACVAQMPKMDSLQVEFDDKIQILSITYQSSQEVRKGLDRLKKSQGKELVFPSVVEDTVWSKVFPHAYMPHYVWIGRQGEVLSFSEQTALTSNTVNAAYTNGIVDAPVKNDVPLIEVDYERPLYENSALMGNAPLYHSMLSGYAEGLLGKYQIKIDTTIGNEVKFGNKVTCTNQSILWLFNVAYSAGGPPFEKNTSIKMEVSDPSKITTDKFGMEHIKWLKEGNGYCYELIVPDGNKADLFPIMRQELQKLFPQYRAKIEEEKLSAFMLIITDTTALKKSTGLQETSVEANELGLKATNTSIGRLVNRVNDTRLLPSTIVNKTGFQEKIDIHFTADMRDINSINTQLAKHGMRLEKGYRTRNVLVISDNI